ncbi:hypothetical protein BC827DRAFT_1157993 [Russula dissimulans]|nr:hypothetical protein BC827DRAFT_1157993 [Russula dissimulans]
MDEWHPSEVLMKDDQLQLSDRNGHEEETVTRSSKVGIYQPMAQEEEEANQGSPAILVATRGETIWPYQSTTLAENDGPPLEKSAVTKGLIVGPDQPWFLREKE